MNKKSNFILILSIIFHTFSFSLQADNGNNPWVATGLFATTIAVTMSAQYVKKNNLKTDEKQPALSQKLQEEIKSVGTKKMMEQIKRAQQSIPCQTNNQALLLTYTDEWHDNQNKKQKSMRDLFSRKQTQLIPSFAQNQQFPIVISKENYNIALRQQEEAPSEESVITQPSSTPTSRALSVDERENTLLTPADREEAIYSITQTTEQATPINQPRLSQDLQDPTTFAGGNSTTRDNNSTQRSISLQANNPQSIPNDSQENHNPNRIQQTRSNADQISFICYPQQTTTQSHSSDLYNAAIGLINKGMNVNYLDTNGLPLLYYAVNEQDIQLTTTLLTCYKANPNFWCDNNQNTLLHFAVQKIDVQSTAILLANGADCNLKNLYNETTFDIAQKILISRGHTPESFKNIQQIIELLHTHSQRHHYR